MYKTASVRSCLPYDNGRRNIRRHRATMSCPSRTRVQCTHTVCTTTAERPRTHTRTYNIIHFIRLSLCIATSLLGTVCLRLRDNLRTLARVYDVLIFHADFSRPSDIFYCVGNRDRLSRPIILCARAIVYPYAATRVVYRTGAARANDIFFLKLKHLRCVRVGRKSFRETFAVRENNAIVVINSPDNMRYFEKYYNFVFFSLVCLPRGYSY